MSMRLVGLGAAAALVASCNVSQPPIGCPVQSLVWSAVYVPVGTSSCPNKASEQLGVIKYSSPNREEQLAIKPATLVDLEERDTQNLSYSLAPMPRQANEEGFCVVPSMPEMKKEAPAGNGQPAVSVSYKWSNVRLLALASAPGTQLLADLEYTENGCTARYEAWAMWPGDVSCDDGQGQPDEQACQEASIINPDFAVRCDPKLLVCVVAKRPPSLE